MGGTRTCKPKDLKKNSKHVSDVRILGFSLCENLKRGHGLEADMSATSTMSVF